MVDFPNVPDVPGVPALPRNPNEAVEFIIALIADAVQIFAGPGAQQWGVFLDGEPVILADSVIAVGYQQGWSISTYPVEGGAFESYNKVQLPFGTRVRLAAGGSLANRQAFLDSVDAVAPSLDLYDIVTPEKVFTSVNVERFSYDRKAYQGLGLVTVEVLFTEVRVTASAQFSNTQPGSTTTSGGATSSTETPGSFNSRFSAIDNPKSPGAAPQVNGGTVQPQAPSAAQSAALTADLSGRSFDF